MKNTLKRIICLALCVLVCASLLPNTAKATDSVEINENTFPDEYFREYITYYYDTDKNGILSQTEISSVTEMTCKGTWYSMQGIEYFTSLTSLTCGSQHLHELDLSKNSALTYLNCSGSRVPLLDLRKNPKLTYLDCSNNRWLTSVNISDCRSLTYLNCYYTGLNEIDLSKNTSLLRAYLKGEKKLYSRNCYSYTLDDSYLCILETLPVIGCEPRITTQPKNQTGVAGETVTFSITAKGEYLKYQWSRQLKGEAGWTELPGETGSKLIVSVTKALDGSQYRCEVTCLGSRDSYSVTSEEVELKVVVKPKITTQPKSVSIKAGKKVTFKVKAAGENLTYQWYYQKKGTTKWVKYSGKTKPTLSFTASKTKNGYKYKCLVKNKAGKVYTKAVKLTVK